MRPSYFISYIAKILPLLFLCFHVVAQKSIQQEVDSLEQVLDAYPKKDTTKVWIMLKIEGIYVENNNVKAGQYFAEIGAISTQLHYDRGIVYPLVLQSVMAERKSDFTKALYLANQALKWALPTKKPLLLMYCYWQLGSLQLNDISGNGKTNVIRAIEYFNQYLTYAIHTHDVYLISSAYQNVALGLLEINKQKEALDVLYKSLEVIKGKNAFDYEGYILNLIGRTLNEQGEYKKALICLKQGKVIAEKIASNRLKDLIYYHLGDTYTNLKDLDNAEVYYLKSLAMTTQTSLAKSLPTLRRLTELNKSKKNYQMALMYNERYLALKDTILTIEKSKDFIELETKYETEKKETQIKSLEHAQVLSKNKNQYYLGIAILLGILLLGAVIAVWQVEKSKKRVDIANKQRDKLYSIVAHDLRTPTANLRRITSTIKYVLNKKDPSATERLSVAIEEAANSLYTLVDNLLYWALLQQGRVRSNPMSFVLVHELEEVVLSLLYRAEQKKIKILLDKPSTIVEVKTDRMFVQTIVRNLLDNAIKFTPNEGLIQLKIYPNNNKVIIAVIDTGKGVSKEAQNTLFNENTSSGIGTNNEKGIGIGLYLCYELAKVNGCELKLHETSDHGSTFMLIIPN
jgi:signal transduction histidine kinase